MFLMNSSKRALKELMLSTMFTGILLTLGEAYRNCNLASRLYRCTYPDRRVHNYRSVTQYLKLIFQIIGQVDSDQYISHRAIARFYRVRFFLMWGYLNNYVYINITRDEMMNRIRTVCCNILREILKSTERAFCRRLHHCF